MLKKRIVVICSFYLTISVILIFVSISQYNLYYTQIDITYKKTTRIIGSLFDTFFQNYRGFQQYPGYSPSSHLSNIEHLVEKVVKDNDLAYLALKDGTDFIYSHGVRIKHPDNDSLSVKNYLYFPAEQIIESHFHLSNKTTLVIGFQDADYFNSINNIRIRLLLTAFLIIISGFLIVVLFYVISNKYKLQEKFNSLSQLYRAVLENMNDAVVFFDNNNEITLENPKGSLLLKKGGDKQGERSDFERAFFDKIFNEFRNIDAQKSENTELNISNKEGSEHTFLVNLEKVLPAGGKETKGDGGVIACIRDISDYKKIEKELFEQKKRDTMEHMASGVAHEIRNPLNAVNTIMQELKLDFTVKDNQQEYEQLLSLAYDEVRRINNIIENFIDYAKPFTLDLQEVEITGLLRDTISLLQKNKKLSKDISFQIENDTQQKFVYLESDIDGLKSLFLNILKNAAEAVDLSKEQHIVRVAISHVTNGEEADMLIVSVYDNGIGLTESEKEKMFDYYYTQKSNGLGLGLNICQKIVDAHKGSINVHGEKNEYAEIMIKFPYGH